jgi:hypothetical protein
MPHYRLYILDEDSRVISAVSFDCADAEAAKELARASVGRHNGELWQLVDLLESDNPLNPAKTH